MTHIVRGLATHFLPEHPLTFKKWVRHTEKHIWNKMQPTKPNAHTYVNGKDVETHRVKTSENFLMNLTIFS